jgi:uracil-DNA glycosylase family 4
MSDAPRIVPFVGRQPSDVLLVGEAPGREEAYKGRPFVGKSGQEQEWYLSRHGLTARSWRIGNVCQDYIEGNPDPTPALVAKWTPYLQQEIAATQPKLVVAVGRHAARWFLGDGIDLNTTHGIVHRAGAFDLSRADRAGGAYVIPVIHPATGFYSGDARALIDWDYSQVAATLKKIQRGQPIAVRQDEYAGRERYIDVSGKVLSMMIKADVPDVIAIDTEGTVDAPWSIQASWNAGTAYVLRQSQPDFTRGAEALQQVANRGSTIVMHNAMYDLAMCRAMGVELCRARIFDTMYAAYLLRLEPQGLKPLAWRWCGMRMDAYDSVISQASVARQIEYLCCVAEHEWPKPAQRLVRKNDGTTKLYRPKPLGGRAMKIIQDFVDAEYYDPDKAMFAIDEGGTTDETAPSIDLPKRWRAILPDQRHLAESEFGLFPLPTLDDAPLDAAVAYAARDSDATLRLYYALKDELAARDLTRTMADGMSVLPIFEEMQATGMIASRSRLAALAESINADMDRLQSTISWKWYSKLPFNPASSPHVATLMRRRGLTGEKKTKSGKVSTAKKSIEHLRYTDEAIAAVMDWRENAKIRDAFCEPVIERAETETPIDGTGGDLFPVRCKIKTTRVATRRLAASKPNLLQIPTRHELGDRLRDCYVAPPGMVYGSWDLSQIEIRYLAHESNDPLLCALLRDGVCTPTKERRALGAVSCGTRYPNRRSGVCACGEEIAGRDFHGETAAAIFHIPLDQVDKDEHRYPAKRCSFGIAYGVTGGGLYDQFRMMKGFRAENWSIDKCDRMIEEWLATYKGADEYFKWCAREARKTGYVRDHWGMYRYLPGIWSRELGLVSEAERISVNHRIQGGAQGMLQNSMAWLRDPIRAMQDDGKNVKWILQVHDEAILLFDRELWPELNALMVEGLTRHSGIDLRVPIESSGSYGETWGSAKE